MPSRKADCAEDAEKLEMYCRRKSEMLWGVWLAAQPHGYADHGPGWGLGVAANHNTLRAAVMLMISS